LIISVTLGDREAILHDVVPFSEIEPHILKICQLKPFETGKNTQYRAALGLGGVVIIRM
jgi:hypothetical protein